MGGLKGDMRWYRGGPRKAPPEWFTSSREVASFYGEVQEVQLEGKALDLRSVGVDVPDDDSLPVQIETSSGEMYEWAEEAWSQLRKQGYDGVMVKQWNASLSGRPYTAVLWWGPTRSVG